MKRREMLKAGVAAIATAPAVFGGVMMSKSAQAQLCRLEGIRSPETEPDSPPVSAYTQPIYFPPAMAEVSAASINPPADPGRHQRYNDFPPVKFYVQRLTEGYWNYHDELTALTGNSGSLAWMFNGATPGETMVARYGQPVFVRRYNDLPDLENSKMPFGYPASTIHLHNGHTASESDGNPMDFTIPGKFWDHHYAMYLARNDSREALGSLWYHDHMIDFTATNVYAGLSGMSIFYDDIDTGNENDSNPKALRLPGNLQFGGDNQGNPYGYDIPLILHDVRFDQTGNPTYNVFDTKGHLGDHITVNRKVKPFMNVEPRKYRFRIYDGGPSRLYELELSDGSAMTVISNDGNLLEHPVEVTSVVLGPANRYDVIIDFSRYAVGEHIDLENVMEQIIGEGPTGRRLAAGKHMEVLRFNIVALKGPDNSVIPSFLRALPEINLNEVVAHREWVFDHDMGLWTVNGQFMDPSIIAAAPKQGTAEIWTFRNAGSSWTHPVHVHFEEFQVLEWNGKPPTGVLKSRKDVAVLGPNDVVKVFYRFDDFKGSYIIHCHNNVHEDNAMMLRWDIVAK